MGLGRLQHNLVGLDTWTPFTCEMRAQRCFSLGMHSVIVMCVVGSFLERQQVGENLRAMSQSSRRATILAGIRSIAPAHVVVCPFFLHSVRPGERLPR